MRFDLFSAIQKLQLAKKHRYTYADIATRTGLHENTVQRLATADTQRVDVDSLGRLITFFRSEGLTDFTVNDLFTVEEAA